MVTFKDVYHVISAIIPLYVAVIAAYLSLRWWKLFTPEQCAGINKFVANFSIPLLSFRYISRTNPYKMNPKLISADFLQKFLALFILAVIAKIRSSGNMSWIITGLSLSTLPNTLIIGIPLLKAMYGDEAELLLNQIVMLQSLIWYNLLLILFELNAAKESIYQSPESEVGGLCLDKEFRKITSTTPENVVLIDTSHYFHEFCLYDLKQLNCLFEGELEAQHIPEQKGENKEDVRIQRIMRYVLLRVGHKLIRNPNTTASLLGITWASIHFRWEVALPKVIDDSISILADGGLGMALFSLGLFMASQTRVIACGKRKAVLAIFMKFIAGPCLMAVPSIPLGLRGTLLRVAIVQAALPLGMVPFVFSAEYKTHPDILSTGVVIGLLLAVPFALTYYFLLALKS